MRFKTSLTERLGITYPIFLAPMAGGAGTPELVAAVGEAGGFGSLGGAYSTPVQITEMARAVQSRTNRPTGSISSRRLGEAKAESRVRGQTRDTRENRVQDRGIGTCRLRNLHDQLHARTAILGHERDKTGREASLGRQILAMVRQALHRCKTRRGQQARGKDLFHIARIVAPGPTKRGDAPSQQPFQHRKHPPSVSAP
jgi:NAD(P)H-dependent flavin oxidoreductase YrpB (nitropropane dioxygenase family)